MKESKKRKLKSKEENTSQKKFTTSNTEILKENFNKKNSKKSDIVIVTIRSGTYLPYLNSDIKISDICSKTLYLPTPRK